MALFSAIAGLSAIQNALIYSPRGCNPDVLQVLLARTTSIWLLLIERRESAGRMETASGYKARDSQAMTYSIRISGRAVIGRSMGYVKTVTRPRLSATQRDPEAMT